MVNHLKRGMAIVVQSKLAFQQSTEKCGTSQWKIYSQCEIEVEGSRLS